MGQHVSFYFSVRNPEDDQWRDLTLSLPVEDLRGLTGGSMLHHAAMTLAPDAFKEGKRQLGCEALVLDKFGRNGEGKRYRIEAMYAGNGGPFADSYIAVDDAEAEFQAEWTMVLNERDGDTEISTPEDLEEFLDRMSLQNVHTVEEMPVSQVELEKAFLELYKATNGEGDLEAAKEQARLVLEARELISEPTSAPSI